MTELEKCERCGAGARCYELEPCLSFVIYRVDCIAKCRTSDPITDNTRRAAINEWNAKQQQIRAESEKGEG